jgi:uncharacterized Ntn-hydrolase superfamily protein
MTYTILGRCSKTGRLGIGIATFSITVGRYCQGVRAMTGVTISQAFANESNNQLALRLLGEGFGAASVLEELKSNDVDFEYRQIGVIDRDGTAVAYTGPGTRGWSGHVVGENFVACGNGLVGPHVVDAIAAGFNASPEADLERRLLKGIEAGRDAGGQGTPELHKPERSAALIVYSKYAYADIDLRVDLHATAVDELRRVYTEYKQYEGYYAARSRNPRGALSQEAVMATLQRAEA